VKTAEERRTFIIHAIAEILEIEPEGIQGESQLREDLGMDSLASLELLSTISREMNVDLEMEEAMDIATVNDACVFVERHLEAGATGASASPA